MISQKKDSVKKKLKNTPHILFRSVIFINI